MVGPPPPPGAGIRRASTIRVPPPPGIIRASTIRPPRTIGPPPPPPASYPSSSDIVEVIEEHSPPRRKSRLRQLVVEENRPRRPQRSRRSTRSVTSDGYDLSATESYSGGRGFRETIKDFLPGMRFQIGFQRFIPFIGYHHILMALIIIAIICLSLVDAGCTSSPGTTNIYLLSVSYSNLTTKSDSLQVNPNISSIFRTTANTAELEIRTSYRGMCVRSNQVNGNSWTCSTSASKLVDSVRELQNGDPLNLIWICADFYKHIIFDGLLYIALPCAALTFLLLATFPGWHEESDENGSEREVKPFPSRPVSQVALVCIFVSSIMAFSSIFWQHIVSASTATMVQDMGYGSVKAHVGTASMILGWAGVLLFFVITIGLLVMILSIRVLDQLVDD